MILLVLFYLIRFHIMQHLQLLGLLFFGKECMNVSARWKMGSFFSLLEFMDIDI
jgi:hypothetical protein